ncbi:hypothetical protein [Kolteria novifilia]|uniref:hypothetical protein n=1 Tax=Kolteria novifilia TaxID=2527975 RepID=UPI003AF39F55
MVVVREYHEDAIVGSPVAFVLQANEFSMLLVLGASAPGRRKFGLRVGERLPV